MKEGGKLSRPHNIVYRMPSPSKNWVLLTPGQTEGSIDGTGTVELLDELEVGVVEMLVLAGSSPTKIPATMPLLPGVGLCGNRFR